MGGLLLSLLSGCGILPSMPDPVLSSKDVPAGARHGLVVMGVRSALPEEYRLRLDIKNLESGEKFRLALTPAFLARRVPLGWKERLDSSSAKGRTNGLLMYALPAGRYLPLYLYPCFEYEKNCYGRSVVADTFRVAADSATAFGQVRIEGEGFLGLSRLQLRSIPEPIDSLFRTLRDTGLARRPILRHRFFVSDR